LSKSLINAVRKDCQDHGVKVYFPKRSQVAVNIKPFQWYKNCDGWFCQIDKELVVWESPQMLPVLAHEYGHFLQWKEGFKYMKARKNGVPYTQKFNYWVDGLDLGEKELTQILNGIIQIEWNCEIRALDIMEEYNIVTNKRKYLTSALSAIYGYYYVKEYRTNVNTPAFAFLQAQADELIQAGKLPSKFPYNQALYKKFARETKKYLKQ